MKIKAELKYFKIAPRKVRLVTDMLKGLEVLQAKKFLHFVIKKSTSPVLKLLNSAIANGKDNFGVEEENLYISEIRVNEGPKHKRWMPRARGSASPIQKKTSHLILTLSEIKESIQKKKKDLKSLKVLIKKNKEEKKVKSKWEKESLATKVATNRIITTKKTFRRKSI